MCDRVNCPNEPKFIVPTAFGVQANLCGRCIHEWRTMIYNLRMNFAGLFEFEQRAFLGKPKPPEEIPSEELSTWNEDKTDPATPDAKKDDGGKLSAYDDIDIIYT